jgi:hypothetical protein
MNWARLERDCSNCGGELKTSASTLDTLVLGPV